MSWRFQIPTVTKFAGYAVAIGVWSLIAYAPVAHWLFFPEWLAGQRAAPTQVRRPARYRAVAVCCQRTTDSGHY
jgi:hypothetical protein